jgi:hypothetical protein
LSGNIKKLCNPVYVQIGVTGHRSLADEHLIRESVKSVLGKLDKTLSFKPHTFVVISPLAEGADRLVAREILDWDTDGEKPILEAVLPLPQEDYLNDFATPMSKVEFKELLTRAKSVIVLDKTASRNAAYEQVGYYVVDTCDLLIAIWDGKRSAGQGGTAEIVEYARNIRRHIFWINSYDGSIREENERIRL